ncbi:MAG: PHP domain-containing protein [Sulfolobaceae archaeon]
MSADFHTHTIYSDGKESPRLMIEYAKKVGVDIIAITDHDTTRAFKSLEKNEAIPGIEVTSNHGHIILLCEFPPQPNSTKVEFLIDYAKENNCIIFPSHPFDIFRKGIGNFIYSYKFSAIEVYNPKAPNSANKKAYEVSLQLNLPGLSNSDSHIKESLGSAYNIIDSSENRIEEILEAIRKGKIINVKNGLRFTTKVKILEWYIQRKIESSIFKVMRKV